MFKLIKCTQKNSLPLVIISTSYREGEVRGQETELHHFNARQFSKLNPIFQKDTRYGYQGCFRSVQKSSSSN